MRSNFAAAFGVGLADHRARGRRRLYMQRGDRDRYPGKILKVRTAPLDETSSRRPRFPDDQSLQHPVGSTHVTVEMEDAEGKRYQGT